MIVLVSKLPLRVFVLGRSQSSLLKNVNLRTNENITRDLSTLKTAVRHLCCNPQRQNGLKGIRNFIPVFETKHMIKRPLTQSRPVSIYSRKHPAFEFDEDESVVDNTLVFSEKNDRFYRLLSITGIVQLVFWLNLSHFVLTWMRDESGTDDDKETSWWKKSWMWKNKNRNGISVLLAAVGCFTFYFCMLYPARSVRQLWLLRGGKNVEVHTYAPFSKGKVLNVPVSKVSGVTSRSTATSSVALKIKDKSYYFLLHTKKGVFHQPRLFDYVIALKRSTKKTKT